MMDNGPTIGQLKRLLSQWSGDFIERVLNKLYERQSRGPTRISGMDIEIDRAAEDAIREWAESLQA